MSTESQPQLPGLEPERLTSDEQAWKRVDALVDSGVVNYAMAKYREGLDVTPAPTSPTHGTVDQSNAKQGQPDYLGSGSGFAPPSTKEAKRALARNLPKIRQAVLGVVARDGDAAKIQAFKNKHGIE